MGTCKVMYGRVVKFLLKPRLERVIRRPLDLTLLHQCRKFLLTRRLFRRLTFFIYLALQGPEPAPASNILY